jgi:hypothetical protein
MSKAFVIEARSESAGIVVHDGRLYRFFAATREFDELEGRDFRSPAAAQRAVLQHMTALDHRRAKAA